MNIGGHRFPDIDAYRAKGKLSGQDRQAEHWVVPLEDGLVTGLTTSATDAYPYAWGLNHL